MDSNIYVEYLLHNPELATAMALVATEIKNHRSTSPNRNNIRCGRSSKISLKNKKRHRTPSPNRNNIISEEEKINSRNQFRSPSPTKYYNVSIDPPRKKRHHSRILLCDSLINNRICVNLENMFIPINEDKVKQ